MAVRANIVLVHGWGARTGKLDILKGELSKIGWKVLVPKLPGFELKNPKSVWGVTEYAEYVLREADKFFEGKSYFVFGHSFGGRIAIKIGSQRQKDISGIILCSSAGISRGNYFKRFIFLALSKFGQFFTPTPWIFKFWKSLLYKLAREHDYENAEGIMKDVFKKVVAEDLKGEVAKIKVPTLILWGRQDRMTPVSDAFYIKRVLPEAKLVFFENEGHRLPYNKPKEIAGEIDRWYKSLK